MLHAVDDDIAFRIYQQQVTMSAHDFNVYSSVNIVANFIFRLEYRT